MEKKQNQQTLKFIKMKQNQFSHNIKRIMWYQPSVKNLHDLNSMKGVPILRNKFKSMCLPQKIQNLCATKYYIGLNNDDNKVLDCALFFIELCAIELSKYVELKDEYEKALYLADYKKAMEVLEKIDNQICISAWSLGQRMLMAELSDGLQANKQLLDNYLSVARDNDNTLMLILLTFFSNIAEEKTSYSNYQDSIKKYLNYFPEDDIGHIYISYKCDMDNQYTSKSFKIALQFDSQLSIIDLYESFTNLIPLYLEKSEIKNIDFLNRDFIEIVNDNRLYNLLLRYSCEIDRWLISSIKKNSSVYKMIEFYTIGEYKTVLERIDSYLQEYPNDFQMLLIKVKSQINSCTPLDNCSDNLYSTIYKAYFLEQEMSTILPELERYKKRYYGISWRYKLGGFIERKTSSMQTDTGLSDNIILSFVNDLQPSLKQVQYIFSNHAEFIKLFMDYSPVTSSLYDSIYCGGLFPTNSMPLQREYISQIASASWTPRGR